MNLTFKQISALRHLLVLADSLGITTKWAPGRNIEFTTTLKVELIDMEIELEDLAEAQPDLLEVLPFENDDEERTSMVTFRLKPALRDLVREGVLYG